MDNKDINPKKAPKKAAPKTNNKSKMDMKKRDNLIITAIIAVIIITVIVVIVAVVNNNKKDGTQNNASGNTDNNTENVIVKEDGTKENSSSKIKEVKDFDGMKVKDVRLISQGGLSNFMATVENTSSQEKGDKPIVVSFVNKNGEEIATLEAYIGGVSAGSMTTIDASATSDLSNAYDFVIKYKD